MRLDIVNNFTSPCQSGTCRSVAETIRQLSARKRAPMEVILQVELTKLRLKPTSKSMGLPEAHTSV